MERAEFQRVPPAPDPKQRAAELRGLSGASPEATAKVVSREAGAELRRAGVERPRSVESGSLGTLSPAPTPRSNDQADGAGRDRHRHVKDGQQEGLIQPVAAGPGVSPAGRQQAQETGRASEAVAKGPEKSTESRATEATSKLSDLAAKYRGQAQEAQRSGVSREALGNLQPGQAKDTRAQSPGREQPGKADRGPTR